MLLVLSGINTGELISSKGDAVRDKCSLICSSCGISLQCSRVIPLLKERLPPLLALIGGKTILGLINKWSSKI